MFCSGILMLPWLYGSFLQLTLGYATDKHLCLVHLCATTALFLALELLLPQ